MLTTCLDSWGHAHRGSAWLRGGGGLHCELKQNPISASLYLGMHRSCTGGSFVCSWTSCQWFKRCHHLHLQESFNTAFFHDSHGPDGSFLGDSPSLTPDLYKGKILVLGKSFKSLDFVAYWLRNMALESVNRHFNILSLHSPTIPCSHHLCKASV